MVPEEPTFTIGVEEEYFVVDPETRDLVPGLPDALLKALENPPVGMTAPSSCAARSRSEHRCRRTSLSSPNTSP